MSSSSNTIGDTKISQQFTSVILPDNPGALSPQKNLTGLARVAKDIAADVYNNIQHWNDYHVKGCLIVKSTAQLKVSGEQMYPDGLESFINDLEVVFKKLSGISQALKFLASQMQSLMKVHKKETPLFVTLSNDNLIESVESISEAYYKELKVKEFVLEHIAHTNDRSEVMFYAVCWTHQQFITNEISLKMETLLTETGHRRVT